MTSSYSDFRKTVFGDNQNDTEPYAGQSYDEFKAKHLTQDAQPKPTGLGARIANTGQALGRMAYDLPGNIAGYAGSIAEGSKPLDENNWADTAVKGANQRLNERMTAPDANDPTLLGTKGDWAQTGSSIPFSVGSMGAGMAAGALAGAATLNPAVGYGARALAAGAMAHRADSAMFVRNALDGYTNKYQQDHNGAMPSQQELLAEQERLQPYANEHGLWEAVPEGVGSAIGGKLVENVFKPGGNILTKGAKAIAGIGAEELPTETITQHGQNNTEIDAGVHGGDKRSFTSLNDLGQSLGEVAMPVLQQSLLMGGGAAAIKKAYDYASSGPLSRAASQAPINNQSEQGVNDGSINSSNDTGTGSPVFTGSEQTSGQPDSVDNPQGGVDESNANNAEKDGGAYSSNGSANGYSNKPESSGSNGQGLQVLHKPNSFAADNTTNNPQPTAASQELSPEQQTEQAKPAQQDHDVTTTQPPTGLEPRADTAGVAASTPSSPADNRGAAEHDHAATVPTGSDAEASDSDKLNKHPWDKNESSDQWFGSRVEIQPQLRGEKPMSGTVKMVLQGSSSPVIEVQPDGMDSTFRLTPDRLKVLSISDSKASEQVPEQVADGAAKKTEQVTGEVDRGSTGEVEKKPSTGYFNANTKNGSVDEQMRVARRATRVAHIHMLNEKVNAYTRDQIDNIAPDRIDEVSDYLLKKYNELKKNDKTSQSEAKASEEKGVTQEPIAIGDSVKTDAGVVGKVAAISPSDKHGNILSIQTAKGRVNKKADKVTKVAPKTEVTGVTDESNQSRNSNQVNESKNGVIDHKSEEGIRLLKEKYDIESKYRGPFGPSTKKPPSVGGSEHNNDSARLDEIKTLLGQQYWQRKQADAARVQGVPPKKHKELVKKALSEGKTVPQEVLADYPELQPVKPNEQTPKTSPSVVDGQPDKSRNEAETGSGAERASLPNTKAEEEVANDVTASDLMKMPLDTKEDAEKYVAAHKRYLDINGSGGTHQPRPASWKPPSVRNPETFNKLEKAWEVAGMNYWQMPYEDAIKLNRFRGLPKPKWEKAREERGLSTDESQPTETKPQDEQADKGVKLADKADIPVMTEEQYLAQNGASRQDIGDAGLHRSSNKISSKTWSKSVDAQAKKDQELIARRDELRKEYADKVAKGELRPPSGRENIISTANGHPDNEATQAARRIAKKKGIDWEAEGKLLFSRSSTTSANNTVKLAQEKGYKGNSKGESEEWLRAAAKGLDMSQEARMARAKAMGFDIDTTWYHGTGGNINNFMSSPHSVGFHFGTHAAAYERIGPKRYNVGDDEYRDRILRETNNYGFSPNIIPTYLKAKNSISMTDSGFYNARSVVVRANIEKLITNEEKIELLTDFSENYLDVVGYDDRGLNEDEKNRIEELNRNSLYAFFESKGIDSIKYKNGVEDKDSESIIVFKPEQIRSIFAAFDPDFKESGNLLASKSTPVTGSTVADIKKLLPARVNKLVAAGKLVVVQSVEDLPGHIQKGKDEVEKLYDQHKGLTLKSREISKEIGRKLKGIESDSAYSNYSIERLKEIKALTDKQSATISKKIDNLSANLAGQLDGVNALYDGSTDVIYFVADGLSKDEFNSVLSHELLHRAEFQDPKIKATIERFDEHVKRRFELASKGIGNAIEKIAYDRVINAGTQDADKLSEFRAYMVSHWVNNPNSAFGSWKKAVADLIANIRAFLIRNGLDFGFIKSLTPADLAALSKYGAEIYRLGKVDNKILSQLASVYKWQGTVHEYDQQFYDGVFSEDGKKPGARFENKYAAKDDANQENKAKPAENSGVRYSKSMDSAMDDDPSIELNKRIREQHKTISDRAKQLLKREFSPGGLLPKQVFDLKISRDSEMNAEELVSHNLIASLDKAVKAAFGTKYENLTKDQQDAISARLRGEEANLPQAVKDSVDAMRLHIDKLSGRYAQTLFDEAKQLEEEGKDAAAQAKAELLNKIAGNIGKYVNRSYRAFDDKNWARKVPDEVLNNAREYFAKQFSDKGSENPMGDAQRVMNDILKTGTAYDTMEQYIKESKLGAKDLSVLIKRKEIAPEVRALLGEYTDARINFVKSATKMSRLIFNDDFLKKVKSVGLMTEENPSGFLFEESSRPSDEHTVKIAADSGSPMAPLNGLYTYPEINQAFTDALNRESMEDWYKMIVQANGLIKYGKTVLSPTTAVRNWMSAYFFTMANAHFDMSHMKEATQSFKTYFDKDNGRLEYLKKLIRLGVLYDTPYAGEMMSLLEDSKFESALMGEGASKLDKAKVAIKDWMDIATKFYRFGDDFWKIIGFENEKQILMKYRNMSESEAETEAAKRIRDTYPTYTMVGRAINKLRRFPLVGTFVSFPAEVLRTSYNMLKYAQEDMKYSKELGRRRIAGLAMVSSFAFAAQALAMSLSGMDDDEEEALRDLAPSWSKNSNIVPLGRDKDGSLIYLDLSFIDPYNYFKRPLNAILRGQPIDETVYEVTRELLTPFFGQDIGFGAVSSIWQNKKESGGRVFNPNDSIYNITLDIANHLRKSLQPGIVSNIERMADAITGYKSQSGKVNTVTEELAALVGFRASRLNPKVALYYKSYEFQDKLKDASSILNEVARDPNKVSESSLKSAYERARQTRSEAFKDMHELVNSARKAGLDTAQIRHLLKLNNVSSKNISYIMLGNEPKWNPGSNFLQSSIKKSNELFDSETTSEFVKRRKLVLSE